MFLTNSKPRTEKSPSFTSFPHSAVLKMCNTQFWEALCDATKGIGISLIAPIKVFVLPFETVFKEAKSVFVGELNVWFSGDL